MKVLMAVSAISLAVMLTHASTAQGADHWSCQAGRAVLTIDSVICPHGSGATVREIKGQAAWSATGREAAVIPGDKEHMWLKVLSAAGEEQTLDSLNAKQAGFMWQPIWSPDGTKVAALVGRRDRTYAVRVYDVSSREGRPADYPLTGEEATASFFDKFRFSPDGSAILLSWGAVLAIDLQDGTVRRVSGGRALAEWTPDGRAICYLGAPNSPTGAYGLHRWSLADARDKLVLDGPRVRAAGLARATWLLTGTLTLSPDGTMLAWTGGNGAGGNELRIYGATTECLDADAPLSATSTALVAQIDWSPDSAAVVLVEQGPSSKGEAGNVFNFEVNVLELADFKRTTLTTLPFFSLGIDALGLVRYVSWSK